ncbi:MAG: Ig-like domain-containing protein, partial [Phycisphaerae bacterium]|nr:Ig-like domain-containing protein [Gemmatimonadaceae bacterium]
MLHTVVSRALLVATLALSAAACSGGGDPGGGPTQPGPAANVGVSSSAFTFVAIGASQAVTASVSDAQGAAVSTASVTWLSDDPTVAEVAASGRSATIVAKRSGSTTVRATSGSASATISILVLGVKSVTLSTAAATLRAGEQQTITADVIADAGVSRSVNWTSANSAVATVNAVGVITAVSPGTTTVTAAAVADAGMSATTQVTVLSARGVAVTPATSNIGTGQTLQLEASVVVEAGQSQSVNWSSNAVGIATVNQQGIVTGVARGTAIITATSVADGTLQGSATVNVVPVVRQVAIVPPVSSTLFLGQTRTLVATVTADTGLAQSVTWSSNTPSIATVSANGVVAAVTAGAVIITATSTVDASKSASLALVVSSQPVSVTLSATAVALSLGNSATLVATV